MPKSHVNEHGNCLLDICKTGDLQTLNGRSRGDSFGKITYHSPKGISTVDYFIVSHNMLNLVENVIVKKNRYAMRTCLLFGNSKITWETRQRTLRERRTFAFCLRSFWVFTVEVGKPGTQVSFFIFLNLS